MSTADVDGDPQALARMLVFMPNRRATRELALSLHRAVTKDGAGALFAPDIRTLGEIDAGDGVAAFGPDALDLPPAYPPAKRRGALAKLVGAWRERQDGRPLPHASALAAADELADLLDQAAMNGGADWDKLAGLAPEHLSDHWRLAADFLAIVTQAWPTHLEESGAEDAQALRLLAAEALAIRWVAEPPEHPVVIAGSTGSGAATRILMRAVMALPRGLILLPGLDPDVAMQAAEIARSPSHPQHTMLATLQALGAAPGDVALWPGSDETLAAAARRRLINESLAPAEATPKWSARLVAMAAPGGIPEFVTLGLSGLRLIEADDEGEEALTAALLLRETLETPGATAALVTPEAGLGRRVSAILARWGLDVAPSSGVPLARTAAGGFVLTILRWARDPADPTLLLALLKHELAGFDREPDALRATVSRMERLALRGPRRDRDLGALAARLVADKKAEKRDRDGADLIAYLAAIHAASSDAFAGETIDGAIAARACASMAQAMAACPASPNGARVWAGKAGAMTAQFLEELAALCAELGPVDGDAFADFAGSAAARTTAPPDAPEHPRLAIWGPLEARLQRRDRMILGGLNEGSWPRAAAADAFLNRTMRKAAGLPDPDERIGLSAHDFAQLANAPEVILLRSRRVEDKPAVASRWIWRLRTLAAGGMAAGGLDGRDAADRALAGPHDRDVRAWAKTMQAARNVKAAPPPRPAPPAAARNLLKFSPTRATRITRDPYADYAREVLRLEPLLRVAEPIDARARGTAVHAAVEAFEKDPAADLERLIVDALVEAGASADLIELERPLWLRAARIYQQWLADRADIREAVETEQRAEMRFMSPAGEVVLGATADRVERLKDGTLAIIDFKTGQPKTWKQVQSGLEPQLALEAAIAARSKFGSLGPAPTSQLIYFQFSTSAAVMKDSNGAPLEFRDDDKAPVATADVAEQALAGLQRVIASFSDPATPYLSRPRAFSIKVYSDYDRLARRGEWTTEEGEE